MKELVSCEFSINNACAELKSTDGSILSICCEAVEGMFADNMYQRADLDFLIYNDPLAYINLVLNGDPKAYLGTVTECKPLD